MIALCRRIVDRPSFQNGVLAVIVLTAIRAQLEEIETALRRDRPS
jgi:hypothetical protein